MAPNLEHCCTAFISEYLIFPSDVLPPVILLMWETVTLTQSLNSVKLKTIKESMPERINNFDYRMFPSHKRIRSFNLRTLR